MMRRVLILLVCLVVGMSVAACAEVPPMINYQGKLMQPSGAVVPDGTYSMQFAIYDVPTGGTALWSETNTSVQVKGGLFATMLGSVVNLPANIFDSPNRWFGVKVGADPEMTPRQKTASVPYAQAAGNGNPPGCISMYAGATAPDGWLLCDGRAVSRSQYASLFAVIGTANGAGDGSTTFNLPDLRDRFAIGTSDAKALGSIGGEASHVLTIAEMPAHTHIQDPHVHTVEGVPVYIGPGGGLIRFLVSAGEGTSPCDTRYTTATNQSTGGGAAHNNIPPYQAVNYIIKY